MLQDALIQGERNIGAKIWVFPLSAAVHAAIAALLVIIPLVNSGELPRLEVREALILPALPHLPPPPPPKRASKSPIGKIKPLPARAFFEAGRLVAPGSIPDAIVDIPFFDAGVEGGEEGGVEGGIPGGSLEGIAGSVLSNVIARPEVPVRMIGEIRSPKLIKQVDPAYPEIARQARVEGVVILEAATNLYGRVETVKVLRSIPLLDQAAIDAVRQWVYEPMVINGRPRRVIFSVTVRFKLQ